MFERRDGGSVFRRRRVRAQVATGRSPSLGSGGGRRLGRLAAMVVLALVGTSLTLPAANAAA